MSEEKHTFGLRHAAGNLLSDLSLSRSYCIFRLEQGGRKIKKIEKVKVVTGYGRDSGVTENNVY